VKRRGHQGGIVTDPEALTIVKPHSGYQLPRSVLEALRRLDPLPPGTRRPRKPIRYKNPSTMRYFRTIRRRHRRARRSEQRRERG